MSIDTNYNVHYFYFLEYYIFSFYVLVKFIINIVVI